MFVFLVSITGEYIIAMKPSGDMGADCMDEMKIRKVEILNKAYCFAK